MKKGLSILFWGVVQALVWAAGHDILSGEEDVWLEYSVVIASLVLALAVLVMKIHKMKTGVQV